MYTLKYFDDHQMEEIEPHPNLSIIQNESYDEFRDPAKITSIAIRKIYESMRNVDNKEDENVNIINEKTNQQFEHTIYMDIGKRMKASLDNVDFDFIQIDKGTKFYKGIGYFYDIMYDKPIWTGDKKIAARWAKRFCGGIMVYKTKKICNLLVLNNKTISNLCRISIDEQIKHMIDILYGVDCNGNVNERIKRLIKKYVFCKKQLYLQNEISGFPVQHPQNILYKAYNFDMSRAIHYYLIQTFNLDGIIFPTGFTPFASEPLYEEITLNPSRILIDETDPLYWKNWGLKLPDKSIFMLNESIRNTNFKTIKWYTSHNQQQLQAKQQNTHRIVTYNVHGCISPNALHNVETTVNMQIEYITSIDADIIILQEVPWLLFKALKITHKDKILCAYNGLYTNIPDKEQSYILVFTPGTIPLDKDVIKYVTEQNDHRDSLAFIYKGINIIATHVPIGKRLYNAMGELIPPIEFERVYKSNLALRKNFIGTLLSYKFANRDRADVIIGDMNFTEDTEEFRYMLKYHYISPQHDITSIHNLSIDHMFYNPNKINVMCTAVPTWNESDHRPLICDIEIKK